VKKHWNAHWRFGAKGRRHFNRRLIHGKGEARPEHFTNAFRIKSALSGALERYQRDGTTAGNLQRLNGALLDSRESRR